MKNLLLLYYPSGYDIFLDVKRKHIFHERNLVNFNNEDGFCCYCVTSCGVVLLTISPVGWCYVWNV